MSDHYCCCCCCCCGWLVAHCTIWMPLKGLRINKLARERGCEQRREPDRQCLALGVNGKTLAAAVGGGGRRSPSCILSELMIWWPPPLVMRLRGHRKPPAGRQLVVSLVVSWHCASQLKLQTPTRSAGNSVGNLAERRAPSSARASEPDAARTSP